MTVVPWNRSPAIAFRSSARSRPSTTRSGILARATTLAPTGSKTIAGPARGAPAAIRRPTGRVSRHDNDVVSTREASRLRVRPRGLQVRLAPKGDAEETRVHPRNLDPELVESTFLRAEGAARLDVEPRHLTAARYGENPELLREVREEAGEVRDVRVISVPGDEDGAADGNHDPVHCDRVRISAPRKSLPLLELHRGSFS